MTAKVIVSEEVQPVTIRNKSGESIRLGSVISRIYEGERVQRHEFITGELGENTDLMANPDQHHADKVYRLGPTTTEFRFVDHAAALEPLLSNGYEIEKQTLGKGGLSLNAILKPKDAQMLPDLIDWDESYWPKTDKEGNSLGIYPAVVVTTSVKPGKAIYYQKGLFRQVCTNGLVAEIMGLGSFRMNHSQWDADKVLGALGGPAVSENPDHMLGPVIGNVSGVRRMADLLSSLATSADDSDDDDGDEEDTIVAGDLPLFARTALSPFSRQPAWYIAGLADQFNAMVGHFLSENVHDVRALDLVNAVTNPVNLHTRDEGSTSFRAISRTPTIVRACTQLIGAYSLI